MQERDTRLPACSRLIATSAATLPEGYDSTAFHLNPDMRSTIERGSAAMAALLEADARG